MLAKSTSSTEDKVPVFGRQKLLHSSATSWRSSVLPSGRQFALCMLLPSVGVEWQTRVALPLTSDANAAAANLAPARIMQAGAAAADDEV
jgi:hypothetical protein